MCSNQPSIIAHRWLCLQIPQDTAIRRMPIVKSEGWESIASLHMMHREPFDMGNGAVCLFLHHVREGAGEQAAGPSSMGDKPKPFVSTRGGASYTFREAVLAGWADDGGMILPTKLPTITREMLTSWRGACV